MKFGVITFPGSNCDMDMIYVLQDILGNEVVNLWHKDKDLKGCDAIVVPGGFSYGDYLRSGAIAKFSPVMEEVMREYVPGVFVRKRKDGFHFIVLDLVNGGVLPGDPMVLLDGVPILDVDDIMAVDPRRIRKLEVVNRQYHLGQAVFFGIVSYTSYQGDLAGVEVEDEGGLEPALLGEPFHKEIVLYLKEEVGALERLNISLIESALILGIRELLSQWAKLRGEEACADISAGGLL